MKYLFLMNFFGIAHAQTCPPGQVWTDFGCASNIGGLITGILTWIVPILGSLALIMIIYAGYIYMTSQGSQERITLAKDIIIGVVVGILLIFTIEILLKNVIGLKL